MADDVEMTPISAAEGGSVPPKLAPFGAAPAPVAPAAPAAPAAAPAAPAAGAGVSTIKLKPVIRKPMIRKPTIGGAKPLATPAAPAAPAEAPKKATQNLKSVTGPIPAQATLKKTGIIAEGIITQQQQQAAKSKTSRISLESAIGVSPTKEGPAPLKTIRLRRPTDLKPAAASVTPSPVASAPVAPVAPAAEAPAEAAAPAADDAGVTQKKTLKLQRPGGIGIKRPSLGVAKPAEEPEVKDIADMGSVPELAPLSPMDLGGASNAASSGEPTWLVAMSLVASVAALLVAGFLVYNFVEQKPLETDANEMIANF